MSGKKSCVAVSDDTLAFSPFIRVKEIGRIRQISYSLLECAKSDRVQSRLCIGFYLNSHRVFTRIKKKKVHKSVLAKKKKSFKEASNLEYFESVFKRWGEGVGEGRGRNLSYTYPQILTEYFIKSE